MRTLRGQQPMLLGDGGPLVRVVLVEHGERDRERDQQLARGARIGVQQALQPDPFVDQFQDGVEVLLDRGLEAGDGAPTGSTG